MVCADNGSPSRRQILGGFAVVMSGASGCTTADSQETASATPAVTEQRDFTNCRTTPPTIQVHNYEGEPAVRSVTESPAGEWEQAHWLVASTSEREALEYSSSTTGVEDAERFLDTTDLSTRNVLVHQQTFDRCRSIQLEQLLWQADERTAAAGFEVGVEYGDSEDDGRCPDDGSRYTVATMVKVPAEMDQITRFTTGTMNIGQEDC